MGLKELLFPKKYPAPDKLADDQDELGWDVEKHGRMVDFADAEEPETEEWKPE